MKTKLLISLVLIGILLAGSFLFLYNQKEENVSMSDMIFSKLRGITGFATFTHSISSDWNGTFSNTVKSGSTIVLSKTLTDGSRMEFDNAVGMDGGAWAVVNQSSNPAQTFTVGTTGSNVNFTITSVGFPGAKINSPTGTFTVSIKAVNASGAPTGSDLSSGTFSESNFASSLAWYNVTMSSYILTPSTKYALVFKSSSTGAAHYILTRTDRYASYTGGGGFSSLDSGTTWQDNSGYIDYGFEVYGNGFYNPSGDYTSQVINFGSDAKLNNLTWTSTGSTVKFQVQSCNDASCSGETFVGSGNTSSTYFTSSPINLNTTLTPNNQYFRYKSFLSTSNVATTPSLNSVVLDYTLDNNYPIFTNLAVNITNNSVYSLGQNYRFNTTLINTNGSGGLEFNGINYSLSNTSSHFYASVGSLSSGTYPYYFWAYGNGTLARYNSTTLNYYSVANASSTGSLVFNETSPIIFGRNLNVTYSESNNGDGDVTYNLYRDNISVTSTELGKTILLGAGTYHYILNTSGGMNYSANASIDEEIFVVNQEGDAFTYLLNGLSNNLSITYPQQINATLLNNKTTSTILLNGTTLTSGTNYTIGAGVWALNYSVAGSQNYSANETSLILTINSAGNPLNVLLNGIANNLSVIYPQEVNVSFSGNLTTATINVNGTAFTSGTNYSLGAGVWFVNVSSASSQNYSANESNWYITISTLSQSITPLLNGASDNLIVTYPQQINASYSGTNYTNVEISINGTSVNIGSNYTWGVGSWVINYSLRNNQNYTGMDYFLNLTVNKQGNPLNVLLNGVANNLTVTYPQQVNVSVSGNMTTATINVNGTIYINGANNSINIGTWFVNVSALSNQNYTANETNWYIIVNPTASGSVCSLDADCATNNCALDSTETISYCSAVGKECGGSGVAGYDTGEIVNNNTCQASGTWLCASGYYGNASCAVVGQGYFSPANNDTRAQCSAGYYGNSTTNSLNTCDGECSANYWCSIGSISATQNACPVGFISPAGSNYSGWCVALSDFNGDTTNLESVGDIANVLGMVVENTTYGKIKWNNAVNASAADIDTNIQMGNGWVYIDSSVLDDSFNSSANVSIYNLNLGYPTILKDGVVCADCDIITWNTDTGNLEFSVTGFSNYTAEEANQSKMQNYGPNNASVYILLKVQYWNEGSWVDDDIIYNDSTPYTLYDNGSYVKLDDLWNGKWNTAYNASYGVGVYRAYASATSSNGSVLTRVDGTFIEASYNFTYNVSDWDYPKFTNLAVNVTNNTAYASGLNYRFNTTLINTNGSAGIQFNGINYSLSSSGTHFYASVGSLTAGTYGYYFWAYGNGTLKRYNSTTLNYYTIATAPTTPVTSVSPGGGGSSGGSSITSTAIKFDLSKTTYETTISLGYTEHNTIQITNNEKNKKTFAISKSNMDGILFLDKTSIELNSGETGEIAFTITSPAEIGIYTGKILISSGVTTKEILVVVNVKTDKSLFDVSVVIPALSKSITPGSNLKSQINMLQAGIKEKMDVTLTYIIKDFNGQIYFEDSETIMVYDQKSLEKEFATSDLPVGDYVLGIELIYPGGVAVASSQFKVREGFMGFTRDQIVLVGIVLVLVVTLIITFLLIKKYKKTGNIRTKKKKR